MNHADIAQFMIDVFQDPLVGVTAGLVGLTIILTLTFAFRDFVQSVFQKVWR